MLDAVADAGQTLAEVDLGAVMPSGGAVASGRKASKIGTGGRGPDWDLATAASLVSNAGVSSTTPARPLTSTRASSMRLKVELAVVSGPNQLTYVSNFSAATPTTRRELGTRGRPTLLSLARTGPEGVGRGTLAKGGDRGG